MENEQKTLPARLATIARSLPFIGEGKPTVSVIDFQGAIGAGGGGPGARRSISHAKFEPVIEAAFKPKNLKAVALSINSPGGSPVQSRLIFQTIRRLAAEKETPVLAFIEDVGASGGYLLAIAADEIFADACSIVGSIGVISAGFGAPELLAKWGVERRVYKAGDNKSTLDPFKPEDPEDIAHFQTLLDDTHDTFINMVKDRRGTRVDTGHEDTFSGRFWSAPGAKARGLIDDMAQLPSLLRARFGDAVAIKRFSPGGGSLVSRLTGSGLSAPSRSFGAGGRAGPLAAAVSADDVVTTLEERALWAQYGL
ncbi:MAG: S49 family peptidase [Pseudomonadota bacterium]